MSNSTPNVSGVVASLRSIFSSRENVSQRTSGRSDKLLSECLHKLSRDVPLEKRLAFIDEFCEFLVQYRIDRMYLEHLWSRVKDFFDPQHPKEAKAAGLRIIRTLSQHHAERIGIIKAECWEVFLNDPEIDVDTIQTFAMLTGQGRNIPPFEYEVGRVIETWLKTLIGKKDPAIKQELLALMTKIIKFNFTVIPEDQRKECIIDLCEISNNATSVAVIKLCLDCFDEIVKYSYLPSSCVVTFASSLCRIVNIERFSTFSWQIMKNVLQTYGQTSIQSLCIILDDPHNKPTNLLRGAVFFLGMSMWGSQRITSLEISPLQILPSMNRALDSQEPIIGHEVCLALRRLIKKYGESLQLEWDLLITMFNKLRAYLVKVPRTQRLNVQMLSETLESIIVLIRQEKYSADIDEIFSLLVKFISLLSEESNQLLLIHEVKYLHPMYPAWQLNIKKFAHYFFQISRYSSIRILAIQNLENIFDSFESFYSDSIIHILYSIFKETLEKENNENVRHHAIHFVGHILQKSSSSNQFIDLLTKQAQLPGEAGTKALVDCFRTKWTQSNPSQTIKIYHILTELLNHPNVRARKLVLQCLLQLRSNRKYQVLLDGVCSSFLQLDVSTKALALSRKRQQISSLNIQLLLSVLVNRLLRETDVELYEICLQGLISMFTNNFMLAGCDLNLLANGLQLELKENRFASTVRNLTPEKHEEFLLYAYHIIGLILLGYRRYLPRDQPFNLIELIVCSCIEDKREPVRIRCLRILGACCIDFPAAISYKSSSLIHILDSHSSHQSHIASFLCCYLNSPKKLARTLSEQELTTLFSIVATLASSKIEKALVANNMFRLLVFLLRSCDIQSRRSYYRTVAQSLLCETSCLLTESNIDLLARYIYTDNVIDHCPTLQEENSILFSSDDQCAHYLLGNAVLSIQVGNMRWVKTILRRASGRLTWISQIQNQSRGSTRIHFPRDVFSSLVECVTVLPPEVPSAVKGSNNTDILNDIEFEVTEAPSVPHNDSPAQDSPTQHSDSDPQVDEPSALEISFLSHDQSPNVEFVEPHDESLCDTMEHESWSFDQAFGDSPSSYSPSLSSDLHSEDIKSNEKLETEEKSSPFGFTNVFSPEDSSNVFLHVEEEPLFLFEGPATEDGEEPCEVPLSVFYPPLPSYEDGGMVSPSFHEDGEFLLGPSPELVQANKLSEDAQMLLHASRSPRAESVLSNSTSVSLPATQELPASAILQESPKESPFLSHLSPKLSPRGSDSPLAENIIMQLEGSQPQFTTAASGQVTIKKSRSVTAPTLRQSSEFSLFPSREDDASPPLEEESIHPSFIFLQLQQIPFISEKSIALEQTENVDNSLQLLDMIQSKDTYKFGICYVKDGQREEEEILNNNGFGSLCYDKFLKSMGEMIRLKDCKVYSGGLDRSNDADGKWSLFYEDDVLQIMYHVVTMMGSKQTEGLRSCDLKKRHIGNNLVNIIFTESDEEFDVHTFSGQFNHVNIIVKPVETGMYLLDIKTKEISAEDFIPTIFPIVVMQNSVPPLLRETLIAAELACRNVKKISQVPNRQQRLKMIRQLQKQASSVSHSAFPPSHWTYNQTQ